MTHSVKVIIDRQIQTILEENHFSRTEHFCPTILENLQNYPSNSKDSSQILQGEIKEVYAGGAEAKAPPATVAADESGRIWGDPHFEGGDGDKFDVQGKSNKTYHLFSDTGLTLNGKFVSAGKNKTVISETGFTLSGLQGCTKLSVHSRPKAQVLLNGRPMEPGESASTADGESIQLSADGKKLTVKTKEGYTVEQEIKNPGKNGELEIRIQTSSQGVARDGRLPGGLLGQTFDANKRARNSKDPQGKGAIEGSFGDYEVVGGIFGDPSPKIAPHAENLPGLYRFMEELEIPLQPNLRFPSTNPLTLETISWREELRQTNLDSLLRESQRQAKQEVHTSNAALNRLTFLFLMAIRSGNINLAMMIFSHLEAKQANELTRSLMNKMQQLQEKKRQLSGQLLQVTDDAQGAKSTQMFKTEIEAVNDDISVLQTFIKEVAQNKNQAIELANAFIQQENQTTSYIIRSWGR